MIRSILIGTLTFTLLFSFAPLDKALAQSSESSIERKREDIRQRDKEIQQLEKKKKQAEKEAQSVLSQMEKTEKELNALDQKTYQLEQKVDSGRQRIADLEKKLEEQQQTFHNRLSTIYLQGDMFYLELLLEAPSFGDFLKRLYFVSAVAKADRRMLEDYKRDQNALVSAQKDLESNLVALQNQKERAENVYQTLQAQWKEHRSLLASLDQNQRELEEVNEEARQELNKLLAKATEEARKKEHETPATPVSLTGAVNMAFQWPVEGGVVTSEFGLRSHPIRGTTRMHEGIDIGAPMGTPIRAAAAGEVIEARPSNGYGYIVVIYHGNGWSTLYAHMYAQTVKVSKGDTVSKGQVIAEVGSNGWSTGPHLHFELHQNGSPVDPMPYYR